MVKLSGGWFNVKSFNLDENDLFIEEIKKNPVFNLESFEAFCGEPIYYLKNFSNFGNIKIFMWKKNLEWLKKINFKIKYTKNKILEIEDHIIFIFFCYNVNIKKAIMWNNYCDKILKFKTKNNYIKGYNKN